MRNDPRVEAVAEALAGEFSENEGITATEAAVVAVAALDAYDLDRETPEGGRKAAAVARAVLAERERIAQEIESKCRYMNHENRRLCQRCTAAARIARGRQ